jgi:ankyrin repeat protein
MGGHEAVAALLLEHGARLRSRDSRGRAPLHTVISQQQYSSTHAVTARLLLAKGAPVEARDNDGWTPLHIAAGMGRKDAVRLFLENGADIGAEDRWRETPVDHASTWHHYHVVVLLKTREKAIKSQPKLGE